MMKYVLLGIAWLSMGVLHAQTKTIDSLRKRVYASRNVAEQEERIMLLLQQQRSMDPDTLWKFANLLETVVPKDDSVGLLTADVYRVFYFAKNSRADTALKIIDKDLARPITLKTDKLQLQLYSLKASILLKKNHHKEALDTFFKTLRLAEQKKDTMFQVVALNGIGWVYMEIDQSAEALQWLYKAVNLTNEPAYASQKGVIYTNMVSCFGMKDQYDSVRHYIKLALENAERFDDLFTKANVIVMQANMCILEYKNTEAAAYLEQAIAIRKVLNDPFYIVSDMSTLAYIYANTHNQAKGVALIQEAISIARKNNLLAKLLLLYNTLAYTYEAAKDYKSQTYALYHVIDIKDSLYQQAKTEDLAEMQARYETEKKEAEIKILQKENELKDVKTKNLFYISGSIILLLIGSGAFTYGYLRVRQKKKLADEKVNMERLRLQSVIQAQEDERKRISAELHDGIGPILSAVKLNLSTLDHIGKDDTRYNTAMQLIDKSYHELRTVSHTMMPSTLLKMGVVEATEQLAASLNTSGSLQVLVAAEDDKKRYSESIEIHLYRIIQELLNNIVKYADAGEIQLQFAEEKDELTLMMEDDGNGYDPSLLKSSNGNGWNNIVSRLRILNGSIEIDSQVGKKGTVVFIIIPLVQQAA